MVWSRGQASAGCWQHDPGLPQVGGAGLRPHRNDLLMSISHGVSGQPDRGWIATMRRLAVATSDDGVAGRQRLQHDSVVMH